MHPIGYKRSRNELEINTSMADKGFAPLLAQTYYVDEFISVQKYYKPLELKNNQSYEVKVEEYRRLFSNLFDEVLKNIRKKLRLL